MLHSVNTEIHSLLNQKLNKLEEHLKADVLVFSGAFNTGIENEFLAIVEDLKLSSTVNKIYIVLTTSGGSASVVERYVSILRKHYREVNFIVPDYAYSAGTIFCMSGDNILMDYFSVLGPIDPQVLNREGRWVAALGYLDKINELLKKAKADNISQAEFLILQNFDLAELRGYEQARDFSIALLKKWLVKYKFKNWTRHRTDKNKLGQPVTQQEKVYRAEEIAKTLSDNKRWHTHGRPIHIDALKEIKLEVEDYSDKIELRSLIREYYELMRSYTSSNNLSLFLHTRKFI